MVAQTPLVGSERIVVLHPIPGEHLDGPIVALHGEVDHDLAVGLRKDLADAGVETERISGTLELCHHHFIHALFRYRLFCCCHRFGLFMVFSVEHDSFRLSKTAGPHAAARVAETIGHEAVTRCCW
jgi:hypothetical protein